jgi:alpha-glucosidase
VAPPPVLESPAQYTICLPAGRWYDYWSGMDAATLLQAASRAGEAGSAVERTGLVIESTPRLDRLPVFVRGGTILPRQPLTQSTAKTPRGPLSLDVYPGDDCRGEIYLDDGHSMAYARGVYLRQHLRCESRDDALTISFEKQVGEFHPWWSQLHVTVHGWRGAASAEVQGHAVATRVDDKNQSVSLLFDDPAGPAQLRLRHRAAAAVPGT